MITVSLGRDSSCAWQILVAVRSNDKGRVSVGNMERFASVFFSDGMRGSFQSCARKFFGRNITGQETRVSINDKPILNLVPISKPRAGSVNNKGSGCATLWTHQ